MRERRLALAAAAGRYRPVAVALGGAAVVAGGLLLALPGVTVDAVRWLAVVALVVAGGFELVEGVAQRRSVSSWPLLAAQGVVHAGFAVALAVLGDPSTRDVGRVVGADLVVVATLGIVAWRVAEPGTRGRGAVLGEAVVSLAAGAWLLVLPGTTVRLVTALVGIYLLVVGARLLVRALRAPVRPRA